MEIFVTNTECSREGLGGVAIRIEGKKTYKKVTNMLKQKIKGNNCHIRNSP